MAWQGGPPTPFQQAESINQAGGDPAYSEGVHAPRGQLNGERVSVQPSTNLGNALRFAVRQFRATRDRFNPLNKQLHGGKRDGLVDRQRVGRRRNVERRQAPNELRCGAQRLPGSGQYVQRTRALEQIFGKLGDRFQHVLTTVENDENVLVRKEIEQSRNRIFQMDYNTEQG